VDVKFPIKFGGALESEFEENCFTAQLDGLNVLGPAGSEDLIPPFWALPQLLRVLSQ
jgi:hypothetical protein